MADEAMLQKLQNAARIKLAICSNQNLFPIPVALYCAGFDVKEAKNSIFIQQTEILVQSLGKEEIRHVALDMNNPAAGNLNLIERACILKSVAKKMPKAKKYMHQNIKLEKLQVADTLANYCRWAGFPDEYLTGTRKVYKQVSIFATSLKDEKVAPMLTTSIGRVMQNQMEMKSPENNVAKMTHPVRNISILNVSPISVLSGTPSLNSVVSPSLSTENKSGNISFLPPDEPATSSPSMSKSTLATKPTKSLSCNASLWSKQHEKGKAIRARPDQMQQKRRDGEAWFKTHQSAFKCSTLLFKEVQDGMCLIKGFQCADAVADFFNQGFGAEMLSGREIKEGVKNGLAGKYPPKRGRASIISEEDTKNIAALVYSATVIEQANCQANRLSRSELQSVVGSIVNTKRQDEGAPEINDVAFFERIQKVNSILNDIGTPDKRELLRSLWLTFDQQKKHYINWENFLIEQGFGRAPTNDKEQEEHGHIVFFDGQKVRILHIDEMGFMFDGAKNGIGGRPGTVFFVPELAYGGQPVQKSSDRVTILVAANYENEVLPLLLVIPSFAKQPHIDKDLMMNLHQIMGKYGYPNERGFNCHVAYSPNGSVTKEIYLDWFKKIVMVCYPDAQDIPGKRVLIKSDGGPGRDNPNYLATARLNGFLHYPGLPNGTLFQELDQIFGAFKTKLDKNRASIWLKRYDLCPTKAKVGISDMPSILFGGTVSFPDATTIELPNAVALTLDPKHLESGCKKCGYIPATRIALDSGKLRQEIILDEDGAVSETANDSRETKILLRMEKLNHEVVTKLSEAGYKLAINLKRSLNLVSAEQTKAREVVLTKPGTTDRIRRLVHSKTAGDFFRITNGGGCMNADDCIVAAQLKEKQKLLPSLKKEKKLVYKHRELKEEVAKLNNATTKSPTLYQLQNMIRIRNPEVTAKELTGGKHKVEELWKKKYQKMPIKSLRWTNDQERLLDDLINDNVGRFDETGLWKKACEERIAFLQIKLKSIPSNDALRLAKTVLEDNFNSKEEASHFIRCIFDDEESFSLDNEEDIVDVDETSYYSDTDSKCSISSHRSPDASSNRKSTHEIKTISDEELEISPFEVGGDNDGECIRDSLASDEESDDETLGSSKYGNSLASDEESDSETLGSSKYGHSDESKNESKIDMSNDEFLETSPFQTDHDNNNGSDGDDSDDESSVGDELACGHSDESENESKIDMSNDEFLETSPFQTDHDNNNGSDGNGSDGNDSDDESSVGDELACGPPDDDIPVLNDNPMDEEKYPHLDGCNVLFQFPMPYSDPGELGTASKNISPELKYPRMIVKERELDRRGCENITTNEHKRVSTTGYLNDVLIQFYGRWVTHRMRAATGFHLFRSHFYSKLEDFGPDAILSWTDKKVDVFERSIIFIPVNQSLHWTLLAVVNCGSIISTETPNDETSAIYHFDSCQTSHDISKSANLIYDWLNAEMEKRGCNNQGKCFNATTLPLFSPNVPQQGNSFDCGLFVCRYLFGLVYLHKEEQTINLSTIENSHLFKFTQDDISRMRNEFAILLTRLAIYSSQLDERKELKHDKEEARLRDAESCCTPNTKFCQTSPHDGANDVDPAGIELSLDNKKEISKSLETFEKEEAQLIAESCIPNTKFCQTSPHDGADATNKSKEVKGPATAVDRATNTGLLAITEKDLKNLKVPALKKLCEDAGIMKKSSSYIKKKDLIQAIMDHNK